MAEQIKSGFVPGFVVFLASEYARVFMTIPIIKLFNGQKSPFV